MKILLLALFLCGPLYAQTSAPASAPPDGPTPQPTARHKRGFMSSPPMSYANDAPQLKASEKFALFAMNTANPYSVISAAAIAGISQAENSLPAYGQGAEGYGKRFGAAYADTASTEFFGTFLFPSILRTDPRYFRKEEGSFGSRTAYAVSRIFVTRTDSRRTVPNVSLWGAALASGALSNTYYPENERDASQVLSRAGIAIGTKAGFNVLKEFWPDVSRKLFHQKR